MATTGRIQVAPGQVIGSDWGNTVWDQSVQCFDTAAHRDSAYPVPHPGSVCYLADSDTFWRRYAGGWRQSEGPPLPGPQDTYVGTDQTITATTATETPTQVRVSITNPNPSRRLMVMAQTNLRMVMAGSGSGAATAQVFAASGSPANVVPQFTATYNPAVVEATGLAQVVSWIAAGASATWGVQAYKSANVTSFIIRYVHASIIPIRYE